jgi:hypothetical protein
MTLVYPSLDDAVAARNPLIDVTVCFKDGVDYKQATKLLNSLGSDIEFHEGDWYGSARLRTGVMTAEAAFRLFNADFVRVPLEKWDAERKQYIGHWDNTFRWSSTEITQWPAILSDYVKSIGASQPGYDDDGQPYIPLHHR